MKRTQGNRQATRKTVLPERIFSLVKRINTDGDVVSVTEAKTKESQLAMILRGSVGVSACGMSVK